MSEGTQPRQAHPDGQRHADRAAQFIPFAALTGYYDLVRETGAAVDARFDRLGERIFADGAGSLPFGARSAPAHPARASGKATPGGSAPKSLPDPP